MNKLNSTHLILFFTNGVSLHHWMVWGMFDREVAIYQRLQKRGIKVSFVTYGRRQDLNYTERIPGIEILCNRWNLPQKWYEHLLPFIYARQFRSCDVIKTNQTKGADLALRAANIWNKPLISRCGYLWSEFAINEHGADADVTQKAIETEAEVFSKASIIVVTTSKMAQSIESNYDNISPITVIPNYIDSAVFNPKKYDLDYDVIFIGRINEQKNITALLNAVRNIDVKLAMIAGGPDDAEKEFAKSIETMKDKVNWLGSNIPNTEISNYLNRSKIFILPSHYEGHPKTLIEAMACGMAVIGTDVPGIREIIKHGENGWLCKTDSESIETAINRLLADDELRDQLGKKALEYALEHYAIDNIAERESILIREVVMNATS